MAKHQIIYTSCMRGIDGVNDGQQVFSYDAGFKDTKADDVKSLFTYQVPSLPAGVLMTEELAKTMPASFFYRLLKNGNASVTLSTYLGRDYMGSAGRFGNHLSHSIICDFDDFDLYPCELYGGGALRSSMEYEEVNNPDPPAYLPTPELAPAYVVDPDSVIEFLGIADRLEHYKHMVAAMLKFSTEKKRIVINDEPENIIRWIAALHYAMPLEIAKKINFTTYEFDPELSPSQICGVISEGSRYNCANYISSERHFVFDFIAGQFTPIQAENGMLDFLDTAFSFSYDSLRDFHAFVIDRTNYREANEDYYAIFYLYNLLSEGIIDITQEQFEEILGLPDDVMPELLKRDLVLKLLDEKGNISCLENEYSLLVLGYMLKGLDILNPTQQDMVKAMIVDRLIRSLSTGAITEDVFMPLYESIDKMARSVELSLPKELMVERNRNFLLNVLEKNSEQWKVHFVVKIIADYVKDVQLPTDELYPNRAIGAIFYGIVALVYKTGRSNGYEIVEKILDGFASDSNYYVNMALNLEGFLKDLELADADLEHLWSYFCNSISRMEEDAYEAILTELAEYERYDEMYALYRTKIQKCGDLAQTREFFSDYWNDWFTKNHGYGAAYAAEALKTYYEVFEKNLSDIPDKEQFTYASEIINIAMEMQLTDDYISDLSETVLEYIPLEKPEAEDHKTIKTLYKYQRDVLCKPVSGKLLLFVVALKLNKIISRRDIPEKIDEIKRISGENGAKFSRMSENEVEHYFDWAFEKLCKFSLMDTDYEKIYSLFSFKSSSQTVFMQYWCEVSYKDSKEKKNYDGFSEFLKFMFDVGSNDDQEMVGKYLCKLSKGKLEDLDSDMKGLFRHDMKSLRAWEHVKETASSTNPVINNLSNLFKRK